MMQFLFEELKREWNLGEGLDGIMGGIVFLGMFCGAFFWGLMSDRYGYVDLCHCTLVFPVPFI